MCNVRQFPGAAYIRFDVPKEKKDARNETDGNNSTKYVKFDYNDRRRIVGNY